MSIGSSCGCGVTVVTVESLLMSADSLLGPSTSIVSPGEESTVLRPQIRVRFAAGGHKNPRRSNRWKFQTITPTWIHNTTQDHHLTGQPWPQGRKKSFLSKLSRHKNYQGQGFLVSSPFLLAIERNFTFGRSEHARKVGYEAKWRTHAQRTKNRREKWVTGVALLQQAGWWW